MIEGKRDRIRKRREMETPKQRAKVVKERQNTHPTSFKKQKKRINEEKEKKWEKRGKNTISYNIVDNSQQ